MKSFQQTQLELTRHLRAPDTNPAPSGVEERRLAIYRDLIFNNIEGFISSAFPVLRSLYSSAQWNKLIRDFMRVHPCQTPYFLQISQEFLYYLNQEREAQATDLPFIAELAHYEWVELALDIAEESIAPAQAFPQSPLDLHPRISPLVLGLHYQYPVERISAQFQPQAPEPSALLVYRNRADQVKFMRANPLTLRFVYLLQQPELGTLGAIFDQLAIELQHPEPANFLQQGLNMAQELFYLDIISHFDT
jgi:uncharacterized protein